MVQGMVLLQSSLHAREKRIRGDSLHPTAVVRGSSPQTGLTEVAPRRLKSKRAFDQLVH